MGKAATSSRQRRASEQQNRAPVPNWPILILSIVGLALAGYLTAVTWSEQQAAFCEAGQDCDIVLNSRWSMLLGLPTSLWGFFVYAALIAACFVPRADSRWKWTVALALFGLVYSAYLTTISLTQLEATCPYCLTSLGLLAVIFVIAVVQTPRDNRRLSWKPWLATALVGTVVLVAGVHYTFYSGSPLSASTNEDPWVRGLAEHLDQVGAKFYGAFWCPHCEDQKEMFGASANRLPYVECSPSGRRGPQSTQCTAAGIRSYPTWIINGRRYPGVLTPSALAEYSAYTGIASSTTAAGGS